MPGLPRRGISPEGLLGLVRNTAPFLFDAAYPEGLEHSYLKRLQSFAGEDLNHLEYFRLCLCAHWATAGTFVPTDVDNAIRMKLWQMGERNETLSAMAGLVLESLRWDYRPVTARLARGGGQIVSTHEGTWFSVAAGAYAALRCADPARARKVGEAIVTEARREAALFKRLCAEGPALETLKACALLSHNFGDLDRVIDQWGLPPDDALRLSVYDAAAPSSPLFGGVLAYAGEINQRYLASENHRHYALRAPRCLRRRADLLIPVGPFFDDWGRRVARQAPEDVGQVVRALIDGWHRLPGTVGYPRALSGILEAFPGGLNRLAGFIPSRDLRLLKTGTLRALCSVPQARFEAQWANLLRLTPAPTRVFSAAS